MTWIVRCLTASVMSAFVVISVRPDVAAAQPIRPREHFAGIVNGARHDAIVYTVCPGPESLGRMGPVASGQTMSVARVARNHGFTGLFSQVYAWFVPSTTPSRPTQLKFTSYRTPQQIPTSVQVPCGGSGRVEFSSCPYLAPCAAGWVPTYVKVTFENIAA
jgi:hypothetical protein